MNDSFLVCRFEPIGDLPCHGHCFIERQRLAMDPLMQLSPGTSSMTRNARPSESSRPWRAAMLG
jgi:hypothetical protein